MMGFIAFGLMLLLALVAMGLQFIARRHMTQDGQLYSLKDSLFRHRNLAYNETGMRYIRMQKWIAIAMSVLAVFLVWYYQPPEG